MADVPPSDFSEEVVFQRSFIYQSHTEPVRLLPTPAAPTYFQLAEGDTGLIFQKTIIYQVTAEAENPGMNLFWFAPFSDPMRRKVSFAVYQDFAWGVFTEPFIPPPPADPRVTPTTETGQVVFPQSLLYQSYVRPIFPVPPATRSYWITQLSEPMRPKVSVANDPAFFWNPNTPNPLKVWWYAPLSEPMRRKVSVAWDPAFFWGVLKPPLAPVSVSMSATEVNSDVPNFSILIEDNVPKRYVLFFGADVSIKEIPAIGTAVGSINEDD